jgi:hypothetical protein
MSILKIFSTNQPRLIFIVFILLCQSCSVRLISDYDSITDETVIELQEKVSNYFVKLERTVGSEEANYQNFTTLFDTLKVDLNTLEVRAAAIDNNRIVQQQIDGLKNMVENLESLHKLGLSSYDQIKPLKASFNSAFTAIVKFQIAQKRGKKNN